MASDSNSTLSSNTTSLWNSTTESTTGPETTASTTTTMTYTSRETTTEDNDESTVGIVVGCVLGIVAIILIVSGAVLYFRWKQKQKKNKLPPVTLPTPSDIDEIQIQEAKANKKRKKKKSNQYTKEPASIISIEPEAPSCPQFMAPDPPSNVSVDSIDYENAPAKKTYANAPAPASHKMKEHKYVNAHQQIKEEDYLDPKKNTAKLYSTTEGSEYYVCDKNNSKVKKEDAMKWKPPPRNPLEDSIVSTASALDYVNMKCYVSFVEQEEPQDVYEPMNT